MILSADLDEAVRQYETMIAAYYEAIAEVDKELGAGRCGLTPYYNAAKLLETINTCAAILAERIDEARRVL
jgi:hypothetical protein